MLDQSAVGLSVKQKFVYSFRDVMLYNISVGAGFDQQQFVYEKDLQAVSTFAVLPCTASFGTEPYSAIPLMPTSLIPDLKSAGTLHMEHELIIDQPIALNASLDIEKRISKVYDRGEGKGAKIVVDITAHDDSGKLCFTNKMSYLNRWYGGFGGEKAPKSISLIPDCEPDMVFTGSFAENTPLLYRLLGDTYSIHVDPGAAQAAGFKMPIVHGLCSLGYACRIIEERCLGCQANKLRHIKTQFKSIAYPGDEFKLCVWRLGEESFAFRMLNQNNESILDNGYVNV